MKKCRIAKIDKIENGLLFGKVVDCSVKEIRRMSMKEYLQEGFAKIIAGFDSDFPCVGYADIRHVSNLKDIDYHEVNWTCECGNDFVITDRKYSTCPNCGRVYKLQMTLIRRIDGVDMVTVSNTAEME